MMMVKDSKLRRCNADDDIDLIVVVMYCYCLQSAVDFVVVAGETPSETRPALACSTHNTV